MKDEVSIGRTPLFLTINEPQNNFPDPDHFKPDRFVDNGDPLDPRDYVFGAGRR